MIKSLNSEINEAKLKLAETESESKSGLDELSDKIMTVSQQKLEAEEEFKQKIEALTLEKVTIFACKM
jgi:hypothetical protein